MKLDSNKDIGPKGFFEIASNEYDDVERKLKETVDYGTFSSVIEYEYYANGLKKTFIGPDGEAIDYTYDDNNRISGIAIPRQGQITYNTYEWNSPTRVTRPGGSSTDYTYDPLMRVKAIIGRDPGQNPLVTREYEYNSVGNILRKNTEHGNYAYQYDELLKLTNAVNPLNADEAYTYDALGNRLTSADSQGSWSYNANNELQGYDSVSFGYDANGNTTHKSDGIKERNYVYDVEDRLVRVEDALGAEIAQYYYDPFGRRLWKEIDGTRTYFVYSDEGLIAEYDHSGAEIRGYGWAPDSQWSTDPLFYKQQGTYYWYLNDHLGTPQKIVETNGKVVWSAIYDSFGNCQIQTADMVNNLRLSGQYFDAETGLYYNLNRYYDPTIGRYLRVDPFGEGLNLYAYVFNNPTNLMDPEGLCVAHPVLAGLGMIPILGIFPDLIDTAWYLLEGNYGEAAIAGTAAIPIAGLFTRGGQYLYKFGKWALKSEKLKDALRTGWRIIDNEIGAIGDINSIRIAQKTPKIPEKLYRKANPNRDKDLIPRKGKENSLSAESVLANPIDFKNNPIFPPKKQWIEIDTKLLPKRGKELVYYGDRPTHWGIPPEVTPNDIRKAITVKSSGKGNPPPSWR